MLEIPLIYCKIHLELNWIEECVLSSARVFEKFKITDDKLHAPIVTLSTVNLSNVNETKQVSDGFERSVCWNNYQTVPAKLINQGTTYMNYLVHHFKVLKDYLLMLMPLLQLLQTMKQI